MTNERLIELQTKRSAQGKKGEGAPKPIDFVVNECRRFIQANADYYKSKSGDEKTKAISDLIVKFIMDTRPLAEGYVDSEGKSDTSGLIQRLVQDITNYGILTLAMRSDDVYEIRCNGKEIKIETKGRVKDYTDEEGRILKFESPQQQQIVLRRLLGDTRLTPKDAVVNARTIEGYRIAALHSSALADDPIDPSNNAYAAFVLRKFKKSKMNLGDIVKYKTLSDNMARLLALSMAGGLTFFTVGPTASGKTTTNQGILQAVPPTTRVVLAQNPSEIDLRMRDSTGRIYNDVLHLEAQELETTSTTAPTMENLMNHILRLSPTFVCFGELRSNREFTRGLQIGQAGHPFNCTFHAESSEGAIDRFAQAVQGDTGESKESIYKTITSMLNIVIFQKILKDGTRRVVQISEVLGLDEKDSSKPKINDLYRFISDEAECDEYGNVLNIHGHHERVGTLSQRTIDKLKLEGINSDRFDFLLKPVDKDNPEIETYIGDNDDIVYYHLRKGKR